MNRYIAAIPTLITLFMLSCAPAHAGPLAALIPVVIGALKVSALAKVLISIAASVALSALQRALKPKSRPAGIRAERTLDGGVLSRRFIIGEYCTAGSEVCPPMSHGKVKKTHNAYLTKVIALSDIPVSALTGLIVNGEYITYAGSSEFGAALGGKYSGHGWITFYDGTQVAADSQLVTNYGSYTRPWSSNFVGTDVAYAIMTFKFNTDIFNSEPECKFVMEGIKVYDPRADTSVGGSGTQRWDTPSTWEFSKNNAVLIYNILRGITLADGTKWGGECEAGDLPFDNWVAAMNVCDELVTLGAGGSEPRYEAGYEIIIGEDEPADIIEELLKGCHGAMTEIGGTYKIRVGPPALPVFFVTDDDFLVSEDQDFDPFPPINEARNTIYSSYPSPAEEWNTHDAPRYTNTDYVDEDDGQEISVNVPLPTVTSSTQVQRLMRAWLEDDRRWRRHAGAFGHYGYPLEPLDVISWTSSRNGYSSKEFEIGSTRENMLTLNKVVSLREVDPDDYDWISGYEQPDPVVSGEWDLPDTQTVPDFAVEAYAIADDGSSDRRPAIRCTWAAEGADDATALKIQVRNGTTDQFVGDLTVANVSDGEAIFSYGLLPDTLYDVRAIYEVERPVDWTAWLEVTTPDLRVITEDIEPGSITVPYSLDGAAATYCAVGTEQTIMEMPSFLTVGDSADGGCVIVFFGEIDSASNKDMGLHVKIYVDTGSGYSLEGSTKGGMRTNNGNTYFDLPVALCETIDSADEVKVKITAQPYIVDTATDTRPGYMRNPKLVIFGGKR